SNVSPLLGVNTSRSDEDRLKLMELMVFLMKKGACDEFGLNAARLSKFLLLGKYAAEGFEQIIDFLSGSYINHALTMNPQVYISCIKQFWNNVVVKHSGVICLPNEEIFAGLARMGYEKPSTKLPFYKAFFSTQWKFFIHTILHSLSAKSTSWNEFSSAMESALICLSSGHRFNLSAKSTSWNEFSSAMESALICLSSGHRFNFSKYIFESLVEGLRKVSQGLRHLFLRLCLQLGILLKRQRLRVKGLENDKAAQQLEIVKLKARVKKLEKISKVKSSKLRRMKEDAEVEGRHVDKQAEIYNIDLDHSSKVLSMQEDDTEVVAASTPIPAAKPKTLTITAAPAVSTRRKKGVVIRDPEEDLLSDTLAETPKVKDKGKGILIEAPKPMKKKDRIEMDAEYARKQQEEINKEHEEAYKNIDWNAALDHVQSKEP
nr:hypothetical protein [Tanacetum cinerariifolium]